MITNPVIEAIFAAFRLEITNPFTLTQQTLVITFPDQSHAVIRAPQVTPASLSNDDTPAFTTIKHPHTYHYRHRHDYGQPHNELLTLHNTEECRAYLDDICHNLLNATVCDCEITFPNGARYLLTVEI